MRFIKALVLLIVFFFGLLFFVQNGDVLGKQMVLSFTLYLAPPWTSVELPFYFVVIVAFAVGMLLGIFYLFMDRMRLHSELRRTRKSAAAAQSEATALKAEVGALKEAAKAKEQAPRPVFGE